MPLEPLPPEHAKHTWETLTGNEGVASALRQSIDESRLQHGILLHGPEGVGKMGFAVAAAKHLMAGGWPPEGENAKRIVAKISRSTHSDITFVHPDFRAGKALQIKIEDVRELETIAPINPLESPWRIIIIDAADLMNVSTANALLKLLEEPPAHCKFFLIASRRAALLATIRSRLMPMRLAPIPSEPLAAWLVQEHGMDPLQAQMAARWSEGRPGAALSLPLSQWEESLRRVSAVMTSFAEGGYLDIFKAAADLLALGKDSAQEGETPLRAALRWLRLWLRDRLVAQTAPGEASLLNREEAGTITDRWTTEMLCALGEAMEALAPLADRPIDAQLGLEQCLTSAGQARG